jgi:hypothetical protein
VVEGRSRDDLEQLGHAELLGLVLELVARQDELSAANAKLTAENERLRALSGKSSGNSSLPSSRDTAAERARQAKERKANGSLPHHWWAS